MKKKTRSTDKHQLKLPRSARTKPGIEEMELWPDLAWRLSALIRAGLTPARAFDMLEREIPSDTGVKTSMSERILTFLRQTGTEQQTRALGQKDITLLLHRCAESARQGLPLSDALDSLKFSREYSALKSTELAACWRIGEQTGAPMAKVLERLALYYEQEIDLSQARDSAMSGPKSTGSILSWLPLLGLGLGMFMGTNPLGILLGSIPGALAAFIGVFLALLGRSWTARLVQRAERGLDSS